MPLSKLRSLFVAIACLGAAVGVRAMLDSVLAGTQVWLTFWPAAFIAAWYGGARGGLLTVVGSCLLVWFWQLPDSVLTTTRALIGSIVFVVCGVAFSFVAEAARRALERQEQMKDEEHRLRLAADDAHVEAQRANRAKDEFLAVLGHELRNPLAPIASATSILRVQLPASNELDVIDRQVKHLSRLVDDLLDVSRIVRGQLDLHRSVNDLATLVDKACEMIAPYRERSGHRIVKNVPEGIHVDVDASRIVQILTNVLVNAIKYTPPSAAIEITGRYADDRAVLCIKDRGPGMEPELVTRVFEPFVQGEQQGSDRAQGGLGLGLAIARRLAELHGGVLTASSVIGEGTTVELALPTSDGVPEQPPSISQVMARGDLRILVVDDNIDAAHMLGSLLELRGHQVKLAHDGPSALAAVNDFEPALVLMDIGLPGMDGHEVAHEMRARGISAPLVALTGYGQESDRKRALEAGFSEHLVKPVSLEKLDEVIRDLAA